MDKYQEALDRLSNDDYDFPHDFYEEDKVSAMERDIDTLQQLIKEHFELIEESKLLQDEVDKYKHEYYSECDRNEELEKALDKATPKKPIKRYYTTAYGNTGRIKRLDILCPCCNSKFINGTRTSAGIFEAKEREFINTINNQKYCMFCSQKLDWSDKDGKTD